MVKQQKLKKHRGSITKVRPNALLHVLLLSRDSDSPQVNLWIRALQKDPERVNPPMR